MLNIKTQISSIVFSSGDFAIFKTADGKSVKGSVPSGDPSDLVGVNVSLSGRWESNGKFGETFVFSSCQIDEDKVAYYLHKVVKDIPQNIAAKLSSELGNSVWDVLDQNPSRLIDFGLSAGALRRVLETWSEKKGFVRLSALLADYPVTSSVINHIYGEYGEDAHQVLLRDPYQLVSVPGIEFSTIEAISKDLKLDVSDEYRMSACAEFLMAKEISTGNTVISTASLISKMKNFVQEQSLNFNLNCKLDSTYADAIYALDVCGRSVILGGEVNGPQDVIGKSISLSSLYEMERAVFDTIGMFKKGDRIISDIDTWISDYEKTNGIKFDQLQMEAIRMANENHGMFSISGYSGTGKTTISKAVIDLILMKNDLKRSDVFCCALSGVAASRIRNKTGLSSSTIHMLLGSKKGGGFEFNSENKLDYKVIVMDEAGMTDSSLMYRLMDAIDPEVTQFIMIGDPAQINPVGAGKPYEDILEYGLVPNITLTENHRSKDDNDITEISSFIRDGKSPPLSQYTNGVEFIKHEAASNREISDKASLETIKKIATNHKRVYSALISNGKAWDALTDIQVISPMKAGLLGVDNLNRELQEILNPPNSGRNEVKVGNRVFRFKDKVIHVENEEMETVSLRDYAKYSLDPDGYPTEKKRVLNGQIGVITAIKGKKIMVSYPNEDYVVIYDKKELGRMVDHAFALTAHKTQGSEFENVVMPFTFSHYRMLNNKLTYTGVTRAKKSLKMVGDPKAFVFACQNVKSTERLTCIKYFYESEITTKRPGSSISL